MDLATRIGKLEDLEAIKRLKYRYWRCLDMKLWDELAGCLTDDATADYGEGRYRFAGAEAILRFLREALGEESGSLTVHHGHHPEIDLTSATTARGAWALYNYLFNVAHKRCVRIGAYYDDRYVKLAGAWKIAHTGYTYVFREEWSREDTPSLRLLAP
jgi:SnoaL-like domain